MVILGVKFNTLLFHVQLQQGHDDARLAVVLLKQDEEVVVGVLQGRLGERLEHL